MFRVPCADEEFDHANAISSKVPNLFKYQGALGHFSGAFYLSSLSVFFDMIPFIPFYHECFRGHKQTFAIDRTFSPHFFGLVSSL